MATIETIEGTVGNAISFHYDVFADVLYLRLLSDMETPSLGDVNDEGDIVLRDEVADRAVGLTIVNWWKRFGQGPLPDSIAEVQKQIEPLAKKVAA